MTRCTGRNIPVERLREPAPKWAGGIIRELRAENEHLRAEIERLHIALADEPTKWSWNVLEMVGQRLLDEVYPANIFDGSSGDPGPLYVVALRNALAALKNKP